VKKPQSLEQFVRALNDRQARVNACVDAVYRAFTTAGIEDRATAVEKAAKEATGLAEILTEQDRPDWLKQLIQNLQEHLSHRKESDWSYHTLRRLMGIQGAIDNQKWGEDLATASEAYDFDVIYAKYRDESHLPELFDELIRILEEVSKHEAIDSTRLILVLERLIATLRKGKRASYVAQFAAWDFVDRLGKQFLLEELKKLPLLGSLATAFEKALEETDNELTKVRDGAWHDVTGAYKKDFDRLSQFDSSLALPRTRINLDKDLDRLSKFDDKLSLPAPSSPKNS
jgi:hypothetical protein